MKKEWRVEGFEPYYSTALGAAYLGDSLKIMKNLPKNSVDLIMTSPPFALQRQKKYGNMNAGDYVRWFMPFAEEFKRILKPRGSLVIHIGGSWLKGKPAKTVYQYELLVKLCSADLGFYLAQDLYWFNKAKLPGPAQWVTVKRWRLKDAVDQIWWLSKTPDLKANNKRVTREYSHPMKELLNDPDYYKPNVIRPSEHRISANFYNRNKGAISPNILEYSNTDSQGKYIRLCRKYGMRHNPARYPVKLPRFFIQFLTNRGGKILDPFGGSNSTGEAAEGLGRKWIAIDVEYEYVRGSMCRFLDEKTLETKYGFSGQVSLALLDQKLKTDSKSRTRS
jgi:site-specific DNA-methyltransferase (cytosine-N4-specific)